VFLVGWEFRILNIFYIQMIYESSLDAATFLVFGMSVTKWCFIEISRFISCLLRENT